MEIYAVRFSMETLIDTLPALFAALAILISAPGLFEMVAYMAEQRTREIGIRKVLGASVGRVWMLLLRSLFY